MGRGITDSMEMSFSKLQDMMKVWCNCWRSQRVGHDLMTEQQQHVFSQERNTGSLIQVLYSFFWLPHFCQGFCQISVLWHGIMSTVTNMTSMDGVPSHCKMSLVFFRFSSLLRISITLVIVWSLKFCPRFTCRENPQQSLFCFRKHTKRGYLLRNLRSFLHIIKVKKNLKK